MKHLRKFETLNDYYSAQIYRPSISLIEETNELMHDGKEIVVTTGWDNRINNKKAVIVDGNITLQNGTYDCYSIQFTNNSHLVLKNCTFRIWQGGLINDNIGTTEYITIYEDRYKEEFTNFQVMYNILK